MQSAFMTTGPGVLRGTSLGTIDRRAAAPTEARNMKGRFDCAEFTRLAFRPGPRYAV